MRPDRRLAAGIAAVPAVIMLSGATGAVVGAYAVATGPAGARGPTGAPGARGVQGEREPQGERGEEGEKGEQGERGSAALPVVADFPEDVKGPDLSGALLIAEGRCPMGTRSWETVYVGKSSLLGSPGERDMRPMTLCKIP